MLLLLLGLRVLLLPSISADRHPIGSRDNRGAAVHNRGAAVHISGAAVHVSGATVHVK
jgi:hypothetical protein